MKEEKINGLLAKLDHVMQSLENNLSCYLCLDLFKEPLTVVPCGHHFCAKCMKEHSISVCPKCDRSVKGTLPEATLTEVINKYLFERNTIAAFKNEEIWKTRAENAIKLE